MQLLYSKLMTDQHIITGYCLVRHGRMVRNDEVVFQHDASGLAPFAKEAYQHLGVNYGKFHRMDRLCQLGMITAEGLLQNRSLSNEYDSPKMGLVLANAASSLDTDRKHQATIQDHDNYIPSPSVFVYTLPNIVAGEISIRNGFRGENAFFIFDEYEPAFLADYTNRLLTTGKLDACVTGWVELDGNHYDSFLYLVEREGQKSSLQWQRDHQSSLLTQLYHQR
jgi:hypothetical protein